MYYTIYKITNSVNNKIYIGKHQTVDLNDCYMGSGKNLKRAIETHGIGHFKKEILYIFETEEEMNQKEAELVTENFVKRKDNYNLCIGGQGGFGYINLLGINNINNQCSLGGKRTSEIYPKGTFYGKKHKPETKKFISDSKKGNKNFLGKQHKPETIEKMKVSAKGKQVGKNNSQFGTCWITNGVENKKIKKENIDFYKLLGYYLGRVSK